MTETQQRLQYQVETLEGELAESRRANEELKAEQERAVQRAPEDIEAIAGLEADVRRSQEEASYLKQELIEARARKSASDDELGTVMGKIETLENTIASLSDEGTVLRTKIGDLEKTVEEKTRESNHLFELVEKMEASATNDEVIKTQIVDLRTEVANAEGINFIPSIIFKDFKL